MVNQWKNKRKKHRYILTIIAVPFTPYFRGTKMETSTIIEIETSKIIKIGIVFWLAVL